MQNERLIFMLESLGLENPEGNLPAFQTTEASPSTTLVDAFNYNPPTRLLNPFHCFQTPQQTDYYYPQLRQYCYTPVLRDQINRDVFPFPSSSNSVANYLSHHRQQINHGLFSLSSPSYSPAIDLPYNVHITNPQSSNSLPARARENIFHTIACPEGFDQLKRKVQHLIRTGSTQLNLETSKIILELASDPTSLCHSACTRNGSRALQQLIKTLKKSCSVLSNLTRALANQFGIIAFNVSGRHVIRECFKELRPADNEDLSMQMKRYFCLLAQDQQGCILLNECIPYMTSIYKKQILELTVEHCELLALNCYGTYVVQEAISKAHPVFTPMIAEKLRGLIPILSRQKEGSHLVEKCLGCSSLKHIVMEELVKLSSADLCELACHEFGNFVVQKALSPTTTGEESTEVQKLTRWLQRALHPILNDLQSHRIGHNVCKKYKETDTRQHKQKFRDVHAPLVDGQ